MASFDFSVLFEKVILLIAMLICNVAGRTNANCAEKFYQYSADHTACLSGNSETAVIEATKTLIVDKHNEYRSQVSPTAANMLKMRWDDEVAMVAQKWADNCELEHDQSQNRDIPGRFSVGQNLAYGQVSWNQALLAWNREVDAFTFGSTTGNALHQVGHYTQMVWATTHLIGCGFAICNSRNVYVCNYAPAGNIPPIYEPYIQGASCSMCSGRCVDGHICDCSTTCLNGATVDVTSCTCTCKFVGSSSPYLPPDCRLNCQGNDHFFCTDPSSTCPAYNDYCPTKCKECPWADPTYVDPDEGTTESVTEISTRPQDKSTTESMTSMTTAKPKALFLLLVITTSVLQLLTV